MQWTIEGTHDILRIRASLASNEWDYIWQKGILGVLGIAAYSHQPVLCRTIACIFGRTLKNNIGWS